MEHAIQDGKRIPIMYITHLSGRGLGGMTQWTCYPPNGNRRKNNGRNGLNPRHATPDPRPDKWVMYSIRPTSNLLFIILYSITVLVV